MLRMALTIAVCSFLAVATILAQPHAAGSASADPARSDWRTDALWPEVSLVLTGSSLALDVRRGLIAFETVQDRLPPRWRGAAGMLRLFAESSLGLRFDGLADAGWDGEWLFALRTADGRPEPLLVLRPRDPARLEGARLPNAHVASVGELVVVARRADVVERYLAWRADADAPRCSVGLPECDATHVAMFVDVARLRDTSTQSAPQAAAALWLVAPILAALTDCTRFDARITIDATGLAIEGEFDRGMGDDSPLRELLAVGTAGYAPLPPLQTEIARLTLDRSLLGLFGASEARIGRAARLELDGFLSIVDQLMLGSFVDDLLPAIDAPFTALVLDAWEAAGQHPDADSGSDVSSDAAPPIRLPGLALVVPIADTTAADRLRGLLLAVATVRQFEGEERGEMIFELRTDRSASGAALGTDVVMTVARPAEWRAPSPLPLAASLSPTLAFVAGHAVIASSVTAAELVVASLLAPASPHAAADDVTQDAAVPEPAPACGDVLQIVPAGVARAIRANLRVMALQRVLEEGGSWRAETLRMQAIADLLDVFERLELTLVPHATRTELRFRLEVGDD